MQPITSAELLAYYLKKCDFTQVAFARRVKTSQSSISKRITGETDVSEADRERYAPILGIEPDDLKAGSKKLSHNQLKLFELVRNMDEREQSEWLFKFARAKKIT